MDHESTFARAVPNPEGDEHARRLARDLILTEIEVAKALHAMTVDYAFATIGCSSIGHYGLMLGLTKKRAMLLADAGRAFALAPDLEEEVRSFGVSIEAAAALARILGDERFQAEADRWRSLAREKTPPTLLRAVRKAIAEADAKQALEPLTLMLDPRVRYKLGRAREILCRTAGVSDPGTNELVFEMSLDCFLAHNDPDRVQPGKRRKGPTVKDPSRAIPAEVKRNILAKRGRQCQVDGCENHLYLYYCHIKPHANGGSRAEDNLWLGCWVCHWAYDHGLITLEGTAENPVFRNQKGEIIGHPRPPPDP